jgi:hypothetical protein
MGEDLDARHRRQVMEPNSRGVLDPAFAGMTVDYDEAPCANT